MYYIGQKFYQKPAQDYISWAFWLCIFGGFGIMMISFSPAKRIAQSLEKHRARVSVANNTKASEPFHQNSYLPRQQPTEKSNKTYRKPLG